MPQIELASEDELYKVARTFAEVHLFLGYGERAQYADVEQVLVDLAPYLRQIQNRCAGKAFLAVYGGDKAVEEQPDLGWLMKRMQDTYNCKIMAIQSAGIPSEHCDYCYVAEQQFETVRRANADGVEEEVKEVLYGGTRNGKPVGGARFYLGPDFITDTSGQPSLLKAVFVMGGGQIALDEVQYADQQNVPWIYIPSRARNEAAYKSTYGPVHEWVRKRLDDGPREGKKYVAVQGQL